METRYQQAKEDEKQRQKFLNSFLKKYPNKAVSLLVYNKGLAFQTFLRNQLQKGQLDKDNYDQLMSSLEDKEGVDAIAFCARGHMGIGIRSSIFIMPVAFKLKFDDFYSAIVDHEYIHAEHVKNGMQFSVGSEYSYLIASSFNQEVLLELDESIAYCSTILRAIKRNNKSKFIEGCFEILKELIESLENKKSYTSSAEEFAVKQQVINNRRVLTQYKSFK